MTRRTPQRGRPQQILLPMKFRTLQTRDEISTVVSEEILSVEILVHTKSAHDHRHEGQLEPRRRQRMITSGKGSPRLHTPADCKTRCRSLPGSRCGTEDTETALRTRNPPTSFPPDYLPPIPNPVDINN